MPTPKVEALSVSAECPRCKMNVIGDEWSEAVDERQTVHLWHCPMCGYDFETLEDCVEQPLPDASLVQEFLPNLIVG